jgi:hypothetical protein
MSELWNFLTASENQETLSWLGGGLVVIFGGLWTVLKFFLSRTQGKSGTAGTATPPGQVSASQGGITGGRNVNIGTRSGMPPGHLILLILAFLGAILIAVGQVGNRVSVSNGTGVGGNVEGSTITNQ